MFKVILVVVSMWMVVGCEQANATGWQYDLKGKISLKAYGNPSIDIEYNTRHPNEAACEENIKQIVQTPIMKFSAETNYKGSNGYLLHTPMLQLMETNHTDLFIETSIGGYTKTEKIVHLGCYPVNAAY